MKVEYKKLQKAKKLFLSRQYIEAMRLFNDVYIVNASKEAKLGILLCDVALDNDDQAQKLFEYYQIIKSQKASSPQEVIFNLIKILDSNVNHFSSLINDFEEEQINNINGILYSEFKQLLKDNDFKTLFEYSIFSTKIVFTKKSDFYEFLNLLIDNDLTELSMQYIETIKSDMIYDNEMQKIIKRVLDSDAKKNKK